MMKRIVVVEDNADLLDEVLFHLGREPGWSVAGVGDGKALDALLASQGADVLVLDLGLPGEDGLQIARRLARPDLGIVMLTARGALDQRITGLESGADAYLVKPVNMRELAAVVHSVCRRLPAADAPVAAAADAAWVFYPARWQLQAPGGELLTLTAAENRVMQALAESAGAAVPRQQLAATQGKVSFDFDFRRLESTISRLRRKLEASNGERESPLRAARGVGYAFIDRIRIET